MALVGALWTSNLYQHILHNMWVDTEIMSETNCGIRDELWHRDATICEIKLLFHQMSQYLRLMGGHN